MRSLTVRTGRLTRAGAVLALVAAGLGAANLPAQAADNTRLGRKLAKEVTADGVNRHLIALQRVADTNGRTRVAGSNGHAVSAAYVHDKLAAAGYDVSYQ